MARLIRLFAATLAATLHVLATAADDPPWPARQFIHIIVPESRFRIAKGAGKLTSYSFNTHTARHLFCSVCGVKSFYRPRSNPDGWSVNARCLDNPGEVRLNLSAFDGQNWEAHGADLAHLSQEEG